MDLQPFKLDRCGLKAWKEGFQKLMNVEVKTVLTINNLHEHVTPLGETPIGFVYENDGKWYLVGYTNRKNKRFHPSCLQPWQREEVKLYGEYADREWDIPKLYNAVHSRLRKLDNFPLMVTSVNNWEDERHAIHTVVAALGKDYENKLFDKESDLLAHVMNTCLLQHTCKKLDLPVDINTLKTHFKNQFRKPLKVENKEVLETCGILRLLKQHIDSKWNIKDV